MSTNVNVFSFIEKNHSLAHLSTGAQGKICPTVRQPTIALN